MKTLARRLVLCAICVCAVALPGCSDSNPARVEKRSIFSFEVLVNDPSGAPVAGLRVAAGSLIPCEYMRDCFDSAPPSSSPRLVGPQASTTLVFGVEEDSRITITINDRNGGHVRTLFDDVRQSGSHYLVWDGKDDSGESMPGGVYEICMVATDDDTGAILYQPDCILASLFTIDDMTVAADAIGYTGVNGRLRITSRLPFPYLYGDSLTARNAEGTTIGTYTYTDEVVINVVDEGSGDAQRFVRTITEGPNFFDLVFDPPSSPAPAVATPAPETAPVDPDQITWSFGPVYPNPFN